MYSLIGGKVLSRRKLSQLVIQNDFLGNGTEKNPFVIENYLFEFEFLKLRKLKRFIIFKNCKFRYLNVYHSKNLKFNNCESETIVFSNSTGCKVSHSTFNLVRLRRSTNIIIQDSRIRTLHLIYSRFNTISRCAISNGINQFSAANIFKENIEKGRDLKLIFQMFPQRKLHKSIIFYPSMFIIILISAMIFIAILTASLEFFPKVLSLGFSLFFIACITYVIINNHYHYIKSLKIGKNKFK